MLSMLSLPRFVTRCLVPPSFPMKMPIGSLYKTFLWEGAYYGLIAAVIGSVLGYVCCVFVSAAQTDTLQLVAVPVAAIGEAALVSVAASLCGDRLVPIFFEKRGGILQR